MAKPEQHADFGAHHNPQGHTVTLGKNSPLVLDCGVVLDSFDVAYQTYGTLNADKSNAILLFHALTGDHFVADAHPVSGKPGWWHKLVGRGKVIDTDRYFVICANVLGGCMGSTGPQSINPETGKPWLLDFPVITVADMVKAQIALVDHLAIDKLFCVIGGSMGGMLALKLASLFGARTHGVVPIATSYRLSAQNIAFNEVGRQAIMADPDWCDGNYSARDKRPKNGLAVARMAAHITYLSETALQRKFGRNLQDRPGITYGFDADFQVESYLRHQGYTFVDRFDANSYLYITRAMDYFDLAAENDGQLAKAFTNPDLRFCVICFSSDWLFPATESRTVVHALNAGAANVSFVEIESDKGHDAFLLEEPDFYATLNGFLNGLARHAGLDTQEPSVEKQASDNTKATRPDKQGIRVDLKLIADMVAPKSRVLDVGCGNGELLDYLVRHKQADARGIEISTEGVHHAVENGVSVIQGNANTDLFDYPDKAFDAVVLSHTLQAMDRPVTVLKQLLRIGKQAIVSIPNFAHWGARLDLLLRGRMPVTEALPYEWWNTPNIHFCTLCDFVVMCKRLGITIQSGYALDRQGRVMGCKPGGWYANMFAQEGVFLLNGPKKWPDNDGYGE